MTDRAVFSGYGFQEMSFLTSMWRVWLGIALVLFFGVPILTVMSWMVGGPLGFIALGVIAVLVAASLVGSRSDR